MNDTKQPVSEKSPEYLAATLREVAETLDDVGKTINARLMEWAVAEPEPKPEPPSVEVMSAATGALRRYKSIASFDRMGTMWEVCGETVGGGNVHTMTSPFSIWRECRRKGVPCPEPPTIALLNFYGGPITDVASITEVRRHGNATKIICTHRAQGEWKTNAVCLVAESPAAIRAACAREGVPCPEGEPREVVITRIRFGDSKPSEHSLKAINTLSAQHRNGQAQLCVNGVAVINTLSGIQRQAAAAGMELPGVTVVLDGNGWKSIEKVTCRTTEGKLRTVVYGDGGDAYTALAPAQVLSLCKVAGWPKPEVRCEFHYCDGEPCPVDPSTVECVQKYASVCSRSTHIWTTSGHFNVDVREPVDVVQRMIDACKEGE